jgi:hypothetical protein
MPHGGLNNRKVGCLSSQSEGKAAHLIVRLSSLEEELILVDCEVLVAASPR